MSSEIQYRRESVRVLLAVLCIALFVGPVIAINETPGPVVVQGYRCFALSQDEPIAEAGPNQTVVVGQTVRLDGSASVGVDLNYTWKISLGGRTRLLYGPIVTTVFNVTGVATVNLTVRDSSDRVSWDMTYITVKPAPPSFLEKYGVSIVVGAMAAGLIWIYGVPALKRVINGQPAVTDSGKEKVRLTYRRWGKIMKSLMRNPMGITGIAILVFFVGMAIVGPEMAGDVKSIVPGNSLRPPSPEHWLGTDNYGIDIFHELIYGARTSIIVGVFSAIIASFLGAAVGLYSGYAGGMKDEVVMRLNDIVLSIPWLVLMIIVAALIGKIDLTGIILIIGLTGWSYTARMVRAQVLSVKERQYIERAKAIGASDLDIIRRHVFPNTFPLIFANTILTVAVSILSESTLSFLGLRPVDEVTWGTMLSFASEASAFQIGLHWWILAPGLCIVAVVLGFTLLGYALDEILNPKLRRR